MPSYISFCPDPPIFYTRSHIDAVIRAKQDPNVYYEFKSITTYSDSPRHISRMETPIKANSFRKLCRELQAYILSLLPARNVDYVCIDIYRRISRSQEPLTRKQQLKANRQSHQDDDQFYACIPVRIKNAAFCSITDPNPFYEVIVDHMPTIRGHLTYISKIQSMHMRELKPEYERVFDRRPRFWIKKRTRAQLINRAKGVLLL